MTKEFTCDCGNTDQSKIIFCSEGHSNHGALVCTVCGRYYDYSGRHQPDEWSKACIRKYLES